MAVDSVKSISSLAPTVTQRERTPASVANGIRALARDYLDSQRGGNREPQQGALPNQRPGAAPNKVTSEREKLLFEFHRILGGVNDRRAEMAQNQSKNPLSKSLSIGINVFVFQNYISGGSQAVGAIVGWMKKEDKAEEKIPASVLPYLVSEGVVKSEKKFKDRHLSDEEMGNLRQRLLSKLSVFGQLLRADLDKRASQFLNLSNSDSDMALKNRALQKDVTLLRRFAQWGAMYDAGVRNGPVLTRLLYDVTTVAKGSGLLKLEKPDSPEREERRR